ncbi:MAG: delta-aminolevulinic acid dehydratase, partial [Candidatus Kryptonium sp.]|nr:delta-aminolevulinic acid dehydratase [Candidatus Kryptonium sp.]
GIFWIQLLKFLPVNLRIFLGIKKEYNPKAMGLFLSAYSKKYAITRDKTDLEKIDFFSEWLVQNSAKGYSGLCWGYNFDWANRTFFAPKGTPTIVTTSFIGFGFIDAYRATGNQKFLKCARSICDFILRDLNSTKHPEGLCFSYTPLDKSCVHNANMLGASFLAEVGSLTGEKQLIEEAILRMDFSVNKQTENGAWFYGEFEYQKWIDSFHTGYNLISLYKFYKSTNEKRYLESLEKGYRFYLDNFFLEDGTVKYYHNRIYPLDCHAFAHALITLKTLFFLNESKSRNLLDKVFNKTIELFWSKNGYFYYRVNKFFVNKIPYMRWVQAWMFLALIELLNQE